MLPAFFVSADWSKHSRKRSVHVADVAERRIWWEERGDWTLESLLELARSLSARGPVLVGLDMVFGVPAGYWGEVLRVPGWRDAQSFLDWLGKVELSSDFFETVREAEQWRVDRPFFHVPKGDGGLRSFTSRVPGGMLRPIDKATEAKPMFAVSGFPGTVGSGTRDLWMELIPLLKEERDSAVWPFEGELETLLGKGRIVLAESYPGLAYAVALAEALPTNRLKVAKTQRESRERACDLLQQAAWASEAKVDLGAFDPARADEDPFDSHFTAAAALRCLIEGQPLCDPGWIDETAEGGMLLAGAVDVERKKKVLIVGGGSTQGSIATEGKLGSGREEGNCERPSKRSCPGRRKRKTEREAGAREYACPIPGCTKVFDGGRGGWDSHVLSLRRHPDWHPEVTDPEDRKRLFREKHEEWFH